MYRDTKQITDCFTRVLGEELERRNYEETEEIFMSEGYVHCLNCGLFSGVYEKKKNWNPNSGGV